MVRKTLFFRYNKEIIMKIIKKKVLFGLMILMLVTLMSMCVQAKWVTTSKGKKYTTSGSPGYLTGWQTINGKRYYFKKSNGIMVTGWIKSNGKIYYLAKDGSQKKSCWLKLGSSKYYLDASGVRQTGIKKIGGKYYFFATKTGKLIYKWISYNGKRYYAHKTAGYLLQNTFLKTGNSTYYFGKDCAAVVNKWVYSKGKYYYFDANGKLQSAIDKDNSNSKGSRIAKYAVQFVGNPYVYGGTSLTQGADCSGFVYTIFGKFGITVPRVADDQMKSSRGVRLSSAASLQPGDLVFYGYTGYASHVAIYIGNNQVVHASNSQPYPAGGIKISNYDYRTPIAYVRYWS